MQQYYASHRVRPYFAVIVTLLVTTACRDARSPTQPTISSSLVPGVNGANWAADLVVLSASGGGTCGWGTSPGETRSGVLWRVTRDGDAITLDEDVPNWPTDDVPFNGVLTGMHFIAIDIESGGGACAFRGGNLVGDFSAEGTAFDAIETLQWGSAEHPTTVQRHWTGHVLNGAR